MEVTEKHLKRFRQAGELWVLIMVRVGVYVIDDTETQDIMSPDSCSSPLTPALLSPSDDGCQHLEIQPLAGLQSDLLDNTRQVLFLLLERLGF